MGRPRGGDLTARTERCIILPMAEEGFALRKCRSVSMVVLAVVGCSVRSPTMFAFIHSWST